MFHISTNRLAGLDNMILKITTPKVPTLIPSHKSNIDTRFMPPHVPCAPGDLLPFSPPDFRPLPPLPSASTLQLPSFLDFSTQTIDSSPTTSLPTSALFGDRVVIRKTKNSNVFEGPQWVPAFHHPNSPYVPWSSPVRRRILPPPSPLCPSPLSLSSPRIRSGAIAPEPWASSTFSQAHCKSRRDILSSSWKSFKCSIKKGVKTAILHVGKSTRSLRTLCTSHHMLRAYDDTNTDTVQPRLSCDATSVHSRRGSLDSLASFVSSDSRTLAAWLTERRVTASCVADNIPVEMSVEEYELMGSWLDLHHCDGGWSCGIQDCDVHTAGGSPCAVYSNGLRTAMPFDSMDLSAVNPSPRPSAGPPFSVPPRFYSLPRLPCQCAAQEAESTTLYAELSMPGGWTFS